MSKAVIFFAQGLEECEALLCVDILRRAGVEVTIAAVGGERIVTSARQVNVVADALAEELDYAQFDACILPGGIPGVPNLKADATVRQVCTDFAAAGKKVCAICAAPTALAAFGVLQGKKATVYPGMDADLTAAGAAYTGLPLTIDGNIITGEALGAAIPFALAIARELAGADAAARVKKAIVYQSFHAYTQKAPGASRTGDLLFISLFAAALEFDPGKVAALQAMDQHLGRGDVGRHRDGVHVAQAQQGHIVGLAGFGAHRIAEKQQHIHFAAADHGRDLLRAAAPARIQAAHRQAGGVVNDLTGDTGGHQLIFRQDSDICGTELRHQFLAGIVGDQGDPHCCSLPGSM